MLSALTLAACGGGGGGGGSDGSVSEQPSGTRNFVGFDESRDGVPTAARAEVRTTDRFSPDAIDGGARDGTVVFVLDGNELRRIDLRATGNDVDFNTADGFVFEGDDSDFLILASQDGTEENLLVVNPDFATNLWNYQTFGVWERNDPGLSRFGVFSAGAETDAASVPSPGGGTAIYRGDMIGWRQSNTGTSESVVGADVQVETDFSSVDFQTTNTFTVDGGTSAPAPLLNVIGTGTVSGSRYSGNLVMRVGPGSGDFTGRFYGPSAEETGGTLRFQTPSETVTGAFGGQR